ncbi:MAG: carbon-nitrogen hydrolase family protein [Burkholderiales bacterium]
MLAEKNSVRVGVVQMVSGPIVADNLLQAAKWIIQAAVAGAQIIALPEYFAIMGLKDTDKVGVRETYGSGPIQDFLRDIGARLNVWLVAGSIPLACENENKVRNSCLLISGAGETVARYDKIHLFEFANGNEEYSEARTIEAGNQVVVLDSPFGKLGLSICYDLRFPELYRAMPGVDLIFVPSAFTETTGRAHWETLLRSRAIENQCYVVAPAQGGKHPSGRETHGDSMLVDAWGTVVKRIDKGPGVFVAEIDLQSIKSVRERLPALTHRII